jgi:chromosome segregation ATPase
MMEKVTQEDLEQTRAIVTTAVDVAVKASEARMIARQDAIAADLIARQERAIEAIAQEMSAMRAEFNARFDELSRRIDVLSERLDTLANAVISIDARAEQLTPRDRFAPGRS